MVKLSSFRMVPYFTLMIFSVSSGIFSEAFGDEGRDAARTAKRSNVVLILIDDLSHYGLNIYGGQKIRSLTGDFESDISYQTPHLDALAKTGLRCDYAFATPLCENTRISIMSGMNNDRNYLQPKSQHASDITFGDTFKRAGYATGLFGKWKQTRGTKAIPGKDYISEFGWDQYIAFDVITEGQRFINPNLVVNGKVTNYARREDLDPETGRRWYGPDIVNRGALKFIEDHQSQPFFLYYPMMLVHDDHKPTPDTIPHALFDEFDEWPNNRDGHTGDDRRYFPDMIEYTDKMIGNVVRKLDETGLRDNTLIVVVGDNGTKESFAHVLEDGSVYPGRKGGNADNGLHVPLILNQPGVIPAAGGGEVRSYDGLVDITDIYPTIADAAGVDIPNRADIDGISFWPQATKSGSSDVKQVDASDGELPHRKTIYRWFIGNSKYTDPEVAVVFAFNKNFKRYAPSKDFPKGRFFDLRTDLFERAGSRKVEYPFGVLRFSGLEIETLTDEQQMAYEDLGRVLDENKLLPVEKIEVGVEEPNLKVGQKTRLHKSVFPVGAKRRGVIWESSDPKVLEVDKFGEVTAVGAGVAEVIAYSWDDARPLSANQQQTYLRNGLQAVQRIYVSE